MLELIVKIKRSRQASEPEIQASYCSKQEFAIPPKIERIESAIDRLRTDLFRDGDTRGVPEDLSEIPVPNPRDIFQPALAKAVSGFGAALFGYLFHGKIEQLYREAAKDSERLGESLQITLVISGEPDEDPLPQAPWINMTPWESLWDAKSREFLATAGSTFFSRAVGDSVIHRPRPRPLRILIMAAAPHVFEGRRLPQLSDYVEIEKIRAAANGADCEVEVVPGESFEDLQLMLFKNSSARARFDVFHFIGHGDFDERRKEGYLLFREADGAGAVPIGAGDLTELLSDPWAPLLVVLNSCRGAQGNGGDIFSSTAATLSLGRVPAVIAMQFPVSDRAAIAFSKSLYLFLAQGATVQNAVRGARRTLKQQGPEWITPVLYLRDPAYSIVKLEESS